MKQNSFYQSRDSSTAWQNRGVLEIPIVSNGIGMIEAWVTEILQPLSLPVDFVSKIVSSARQAVELTLGSANTEIDCEHIHLRIFTQGIRNQNGQTWGFFRIEKARPSSESEVESAHMIDFYLYLEKGIATPGNF